MGSDSSAITVLPGLEAVRRRPLLYFGCEREDPALPARVMGLMVADALVDPRDHPQTEPRQVKVTVVDDLRFRIEDNEPGWILDQRYPSADMLVLRALTVLGVGGWARWGAGVTIGVAMCSEVVAELCIDGRRYRQRITMPEPPGPAENLGPADEEGPLVDFRLDGSFLPATSALPPDPADALFELLEYDPPSSRFNTRPAPRPGTRLEVHDLRSGTTATAYRGDH